MYSIVAEFPFFDASKGNEQSLKQSESLLLNT